MATIYDKRSFLAGLAAGRQMKGWASGGSGSGGGVHNGRPELDKYYKGTYGVKWEWGLGQEHVSRLTIENDPHRLVGNNEMEAPVPQKNGQGGSSPFDTILPWAGMEEYNVLYDGTFIKSGEEGFARSGKDVNVMVWIPEFYYKIVDDTDNKVMCFYVSSEPHPDSDFALHPGSGRYVGRYTTSKDYDMPSSQSGAASLVNKTLPDFRTEAATMGTKWHLWDYATWSAIWLLYLVEYANLDSQTAVAGGYYDSHSSALPTGKTDEMTYHTGWPTGTDGSTAMQYRHIENLWGNIDQWVDGWNTMKVSTDPSQYTSDSTNSSYKTINLQDTPWAVTPGFSKHGFSYDYTTSGSDPCLSVGGYWLDSASYAGLWCAYSDSASYVYSGIGARLLVIP